MRSLIRVAVAASALAVTAVLSVTPAIARVCIWVWQDGWQQRCIP